MMGKVLTAVGVTLLLFSACAQEEDLSDINDEWTSAHDELLRSVQQARQSHAELRQRFDALGEPELDDPELITLRNEVESTLDAHTTTLDEIDSMLEESASERRQALEHGRRGEFESTWSAEKTEYAGARAKLDELNAQHENLSGRIDQLYEATGVEEVDRPTGASAR